MLTMLKIGEREIVAEQDILDKIESLIIMHSLLDQIKITNNFKIDFGPVDGNIYRLKLKTYEKRLQQMIFIKMSEQNHYDNRAITVTTYEEMIDILNQVENFLHK